MRGFFLYFPINFKFQKFILIIIPFVLKQRNFVYHVSKVLHYVLDGRKGKCLRWFPQIERILEGHPLIIKIFKLSILSLLSQFITISLKLVKYLHNCQFIGQFLFLSFPHLFFEKSLQKKMIYIPVLPS